MIVFVIGVLFVAGHIPDFFEDKLAFVNADLTADVLNLKRQCLNLFWLRLCRWRIHN
jgi:hypothetical protein